MKTNRGLKREREGTKREEEEAGRRRERRLKERRKEDEAERTNETSSRCHLVGDEARPGIKTLAREVCEVCVQSREHVSSR